MQKFTISLILIISGLGVLWAYPAYEYPKHYSYGQSYDGTDEDIISRQTRGGGRFDSLQLGGAFGVSKRLEPVRNQRRDDSLGKVTQRRGSLDSLVAGGVFGKAAKRSYENLNNLEQLHRDTRTLDTLTLGGPFGGVAKRNHLDVLGISSFGTDKKDVENDQVKAFLNKSSSDDSFYKQVVPNAYLMKTLRYPFYNVPKYDELIL